jgi:6-pyruvoyl-tetrahydropterin synthase
MRSTLFLNNITAIDHAYIDPYGILRGGSYHLSVKVSGEVIGAEQVVVDFSTLKHSIKDIVDGDEGYDHKLWIIQEFSRATVVKNKHNWEIDNWYLNLELPENAIKFFELGGAEKIQDLAKTNIQHTLLIHLQKMYPGVHIDVEVMLSEHMFFPNSGGSVLKFRYVHGLKDSSSWGCQNIAHGHLSFIHFNETNPDKKLNKELFHFLSGGNNIFVFRDNVIEETPQIIRIKYTTGRGTFTAIFNKIVYNIIILEKETTVENIAEWFKETHKEILNEFEIGEIHVSEGLQKGAVISGE